MAEQPTQWTITTQQEGSRPNATGQYVEGVTIGFQTINGLTGTVFVPNTQYNPQAVKDLINARVAAMQAVQGLKG